MSLPTLADWKPTAHDLHKVAHLLGALRLFALPHVPGYLEYALKVTPEGLSTDVLPSGREVILNMQRAAVTITNGEWGEINIPLADHSQASLFEAVLGALAFEGVSAQAATGGSLIDGFLATMTARGNILLPKREELADTTPLDPDPQVARDYAMALYEIFTGIARFRARLSGPLTPMVVWPEHFDLSFIWYAKDADDNAPQMNFGFAPFSPGMDRPYLYVTVYPLPADFTPPTLPDAAHWINEPWRGIVLSYDSIATQNDPDMFVEECCLAIHRAMKGLLGK